MTTKTLSLTQFTEGYPDNLTWARTKRTILYYENVNCGMLIPTGTSVKYCRRLIAVSGL